MALGAVAMLVLGAVGRGCWWRGGRAAWRRWFTRLRGPLAGRLHVEIARVAVVGLLLSSVTALWMTASTFDLLPDSAATADGSGAAKRQDRRCGGGDRPVAANSGVRAARAVASPMRAMPAMSSRLRPTTAPRHWIRAAALSFLGLRFQDGSGFRKPSTCCTPAKAPQPWG